MEEELNIDELLRRLEKYPQLTPLQRIILSSTSTVQSMLSVLFKSTVIAKLISEKSFGTVDIRWVRLVKKDTDEVVCLAESVLPHGNNSKEFLNALRKGEEGGIGMVIAKREIKTERKILGLYADENIFSRTYSLTGKSVEVTITEIFPNNIYHNFSVLIPKAE